MGSATAGPGVPRFRSGLGALLMVAALSLVGEAAAQDYGDHYGSRLGRQEAGRAVYYPTGSGMVTDALVPSLQKWYLPQELRGEYSGQWDYTNYSRSPYMRYIDPAQQGDSFYDLYGRLLTRGWLVYSWRQVQPLSSQGSAITKSPGQYQGWMNKLVVSSDAKGQRYFGVTIGDELHTVLTPMTFNKTAFNGIQFDYRSDRFTGTALISRLNNPVVLTDGNPVFFDNFTNLWGLRGVWGLGDFVRVGGTMVNAHNGKSSSGRFSGNPFTGGLTTGQLQDRINRIVLRISDDSPEDGEGGPVLFASEIEITTRIREQDTVLVGSRIGFLPKVEGGVIRDGFLAADGGGETGLITLEYVFSSTDAAAIDLETLVPELDLVNNIRQVRFRLLLSNDYKVEITSDRQTDNAHAAEQPQFLTVVRAPGNVIDSSNQRWVEFEYGVPTANQILGFTVEVEKFLGFALYGEFNLNHRFRQYPNINRDTHSTSAGIDGDRAAKGWMVNISRYFSPFYFFGEAFGMDPEYNTGTYIVDGSGRANYANTDEARSRYSFDFVDDNDDNDRKNDQQRLFDDSRTDEERGNVPRTLQGYRDEAVFPGLDENNDFISDFNQNNTAVRPNFLPDYEEPFLRHNVDRPEFIFALDMNNNGWGDRFENDDAPDYPYQRDRRGYNAYVNTQVTPEFRIMVGRKRIDQISTGDRDRTNYALVAYSRDFAGLGRLSFFDMAKLAKDHIADDLVQWVQPRPKLGRPANTGGFMQVVRDPVAMQDTWVNQLSLELERDTNSGLNASNKVMYDVLRQRGSLVEAGADFAGARDTRRFGVISRLDYIHQLGSLVVQPRAKYELFLDNTPYSIEKVLGDEQATRKDWSGILSLLFRYPLLRKTTVEAGVEHLRFRDFSQREVAVLENPVGLNKGDPTGDYSQTSFAIQFANTTSYLGYNLIAQIGIRLDRGRIELFAEDDRAETNGMSYATVYASIK